MSQVIRVLVVEDAPADVDLMVRELKRAGLNCDSRRVETAADFRRQLDEFHPHVILSDFTMPTFDGMQALSIARHSYPFIPFIFVSATLGEDYAVRALKSGAMDYVLKSNLLRLPAAVERAIKETEERQAFQGLQHRLRESEKQYRELFQNNPHPMWVYDVTTLRFLEVNDTAVARYGFSRDEFRAMTIKDIRPEKEVSRLLDHVAERLPIVNAPQSWRHRTKRGELIDVEISSHDFEVEGRPARIVVAYDITERRRAESALRESEYRLDLALAASGLATWEWVFPTGEVRFGERWWPILGYQPHEIPMRVDAWEKLTHEDDYARVKSMVAAVAKGTIQVLEVEYRMQAKDGRWRWIRSVGRVVERDAAGLVVRMTGTHGDITERKQAEQRLWESEAKYRQLIEQASDGIFVSDREGNVILANSRWCELLGYAPDEIAGMNARQTYLEDDLDSHRKRLELARAGQVLRFERMVRRKDGSAFPAEISLKMLDNGMLQGIFHDITTRRAHEEKIARLSRIQQMMSGINSAIVRIRERQELFNQACRIAVEHGGFTLGWIAQLDRLNGTLVPVAQAGLPVDLSADGTSSNRSRVGLVPGGPAAIALREKRPAIDNDIAYMQALSGNAMGSDALSVRRAAIQVGAKSVIVLPLYVEGRVFGVLILYAPERNFFDDEELKLLTELAGDISFGLEFIAKEEKVAHLAYYDPLTDLPNRTLFSERLSQQLHTRADSPDLVAVVLMDVERLRMINDTLGRQTGDEILRSIARRLAFNATTSRFSNLARLLGDAFGVIIRGARNANELAQLIKEGMKACFGLPFTIDGKELRIEARAGVSAYPLDGSTAESLLSNAEAALRNAKRTKERFVFYAPEMTARVSQFLALETKLRKAIELEQFVLHYQPKINAASGKTTGVEALIRWNDPESGLVPPLKFIQVLEETGMIFEVGRWALRQALADQQRWRGKGLSRPRVAVNVSAQQLRDPHFVPEVQLALASQEGLKPELELEITESLLMEDIERNIERLKTLRGLGVTIAIDDFGTGYSSLNYLARLPMDTLKIDRSFVVSMTESQESKTIVSTIISLAHSLGLNVVAEGVETAEQFEFLKSLHCDAIQGYYFSRPVDADAIAKLLG